MYVIRGKRGISTFDSSKSFEEGDRNYRILESSDWTLLIRELDYPEISKDTYKDRCIYLFDLKNKNPEEGNLGIPCLALQCFEQKNVTVEEAVNIIRGKEK